MTMALFLTATSDPAPITDIIKSVLLYAFLAEIIGVPVAWLRVRKLDAWRERPREEGHIGLLSRYIALVTTLVVAWGVLVSVSVVISSRL
jgi:hypothetical protein